MFKFRGHLKHLTSESYSHQQDYLISDPLDCSLGTNPFGFPQGVLRVAQMINYNLINNYPNVDESLKNLIKEYWNNSLCLDENQIELACGSIDSIAKINKLFIDVGTPVLGYTPQFPDFQSDVESLGGIYESVEMNGNNGRFNASLFLDHLQSKYVMAYIDNPNNPTGQVIPIETIMTIAQKAADLNICLVVDEAYGDFMDVSNSVVNLLDQFNNLIVIRSFSKGFGMAGLRVGYTISSQEIMSYYRKVNVPFSVNSIAGCLVGEALKDSQFLQSSRKKVEILKSRLIQGIRTLGYLETDPETPIITLIHPDKNINLHSELLKQQVISVAGTNFPGLGSHCVRVRIPSEVNLLIERINSLTEPNQGGHHEQ